MRKSATALACAAALAATPAFARSPFDGSWKADPASIQWPSKPDIYVVQGGVYSCRSCLPAFTIPADGAFHAVLGQPYFDQQSVRVVDSRTVAIVQRKSGRQVGESLSTVSPDGRTLSYRFRDTSSPTGKIVAGSGAAERVGSGPAGAHAISGSWRQSKLDAISPEARRVSLRLDDGILHLSAPTGIAYDARIGGPPVPIRGDLAATLAAVRQVGPATLVETDTRGGRIVCVTTMTLQPSGRAMTVTFEDKVQAATTRYTAHRE